MPKSENILLLLAAGFFVATLFAMVWFCVLSLGRPTMTPVALLYASPFLVGAICVGGAAVIRNRRRTRACQSEGLT
jgi:hypothetical protein